MNPEVEIHGKEEYRLKSQSCELWESRLPNRLVGKIARFTYPSFGTPDSHPDYSEHSGQFVRILRRYRPPEIDEEIVEAIFWIEAADGWIGTANRSELRVSRTLVDLPRS